MPISASYPSNWNLIKILGEIGIKSLEDNFKDLASYAIMNLIEMRKSKKLNYNWVEDGDDGVEYGRDK